MRTKSFSSSTQSGKIESNSDEDKKPVSFIKRSQYLVSDVSFSAISSLLMKAELVKSDSEFNSRILQLDTMYLSEKMEMINRFKSISNIFLMDDMKCQVKWYTNQIDGPYGVYCYPLEEMSTTKSYDFLAHIDMKLYDYNIFIEEEGQSDNRNTELKLCLYEKIYESSKGVVVFEISKYLEDMNNIFADDYERKSEIKALLINNKLIEYKDIKNKLKITNIDYMNYCFKKQ